MERPEPKNPERVLVLHTAFAGDIVLATPALAALRSLLPAARILFLTTPVGVKLLSPNPWGIELLAYDKRGREKGPAGFWRKSRELKAFAPELVISLHRSFRSSLLARSVGGESWGFREAAGSFFLRHRVSRSGIAYEAQKNLAVVEGWAGRGGFSPYPSLATAPGDEQEAERLLSGLSDFSAVAPSSVWATKRWPAEKFGALVHELWRDRGLTSVLVGSDAPEDKAAAAAVVAEAQRLGGSAPLNLTGRTSLGGLKAVLSRARIVISNDSSPLHVGIAMGRPVVGIFGPTTRELGFFPLAPAGRSAVAEVSGLPCRPCGLHGHHRCPETHFRCMRDLDLGAVLKEIDNLLCP